MNCIVSDNEVSNNGGGVYVQGVATASFSKCTVSNNTARNTGGGIDANGADATIHLGNCTVSGNIVSSIPNALGHGGGISSFQSTVNLTNCLLSGNRAGQTGGAIFAILNASTSITNGTISGNDAGSGGGIANSAGSNLTGSNCLIWNNRAIDNSDSIGSDSSSTENFTHSLAEGLVLAGAGNLDGTTPANNPQFTTPFSPQLRHQALLATSLFQRGAPW